MTTNSRAFVSRATVLLGAVALALGLAGCLEKRLVWSPDGAEAAVIADGDLRFCALDGTLSAAVAPQIYAVAWLADSKRLVLARGAETGDWAMIARLVGAERATAIETRADADWSKLAAGAPWSVIGMDLGDNKAAFHICLRDRHAAELRAKLSAGEWSELAETRIDFTQLLLARRTAEGVELGKPFYEAIGRISDVRASPQRDRIAFTIEMKPEDKGLQLVVASIDGSSPPRVVARHVAAYPDWADDGRSVVYFESGGGSDSQDVVTVGVLVRREVSDTRGQIAIADKPQYLAGTFFGQQARVRCLRDGRILFNTPEFSLPAAADDYGDQREQLFVLDPSHQPTLTRLIARRAEEHLPQQLAFFEVSPDERQVVFGMGKGRVDVLTLASGAVENVQADAKNPLQSAPVWRADGALTYVKRAAVAGAASAGTHRVDYAVRRGEKETLLSANWPVQVVDALVAENER